MSLSDTAIRNAKPGITPKGEATNKSYKMGDSGGLYLEVAPSGGKWWRFKYRFGGKEKRLSLGVYPDVSLKEARERRDAARKLLVNDIDPGENRKAQKAAKVDKASNCFEVVAREWFSKNRDTWAPSHADKIIARLERDVFPWLGNRPVAEINSPEVLGVLRRIEDRGTLDTAHRAKGNISQVMRYAIATGRAVRDPCPDLRGALPPARENNFPAITDPKAVGELMRAIDGYQGTFVVKCALRLAPLLFIRPGELRQAEWSEFSLDENLWVLPSERRKLTRDKKGKREYDHIIPLSSQAVEILRGLYPLTGRGRRVFPGRNPQKPMSNATINSALRRMGYDTKTEITGHGFRAMARTILDEELHISPDVIERQLAHTVPDALGTAYNRTQFLKERRTMMQQWSDYLDKLKSGADVIPLHTAP